MTISNEHPPQIVGVAIQLNGLLISLARPHRHHDILHRLPAKDNLDQIEEGFLTSEGKFLDRRSAFALASSNGQLNRRPGAQFYQGDQLFSEDLW